MRRIYNFSAQEAIRLEKLGWKKILMLCQISGVDWFTVYEASNDRL